MFQTTNHMAWLGMVCPHMRCTPRTTPPDEAIRFGFPGFLKIAMNSKFPLQLHSITIEAPWNSISALTSIFPVNHPINSTNSHEIHLFPWFPQVCSAIFPATLHRVHRVRPASTARRSSDARPRPAWTRPGSPGWIYPLKMLDLSSSLCGCLPEGNHIVPLYLYINL